MAKRKSTPVASSTKRVRGSSGKSQSVLFEECEMPFIRLRGFWLACAGFEPAATLKVRVSKGRIVVSRR